MVSEREPEESLLLDIAISLALYKNKPIMNKVVKLESKWRKGD